MSDHSRITWTDATWNPMHGCSRVSEGCEHCYAETLSHRYGWTHHPWTTQHAAENITLHPERFAHPLHWRKPRRIFVNSTSDLWHDEISEATLDTLWAIMARCPHHTFQILTKRPERMHTYLTDPETPARIAARSRLIGDGQHLFPLPAHSLLWPLPHVWLGVSAENQRWADHRIPQLLATPATVRFVSCEPLLGPIDLAPWILPKDPRAPRLHWIIAGAESGPDSRPMEDAWVRTLRDACQTAAIAFFFKQRATPSGHKLIHPLLDGQLWEHYPPDSRPAPDAQAPHA